MADAPNVIEWDADVAPLLKKYEELNAAEKKRQALVELGGKNLGKAYDQQARAIANAAKEDSKWVAALKENTAASLSAKASINQTAEATGKLAAALGLVDPRLGAIAQGLQKIEGVASAAATGAEVLGTSLATVGAAMGAVAIAAVPAYLAWQQSNKDLADMDQWLKVTTADLADMEKGVQSITDAQAELDKRQQKLRGNMTAQEAATYAEADAQKVYQGELEATGTALDHATEKLKEMKRRAYDKSFFEFLGDSFNPFSDSVSEAIDKIKKQEKEVERLKGNVTGLKGEQEKYAGTLAKVTLAEERASGAKAGRAKATADANAALKAEIDLLLAAEKAEADHYAAIHKAVDALNKQATSSRKAGQSEEERIETERQAALAQADSIARTALMEAKTADERRDIDRALADDRVAINKQADDAITANQLAALEVRRQAERDAAAEAKALREKEASDTLSGVSSLLNSIQGFYDADIAAKQKAADAGDKTAQNAIKEDFNRKQTAAVSQAVIDGILAELNVLASVPFPASLIASAAVGATVAADIAAIESTAPPTFNDTPGPVSAPVQNYQPTFKKNDIIIAAQSPQEVQRQASSLGGGSRWGGPSTARQLAQLNTGWMLNQQLALVTRGVSR